MNTHEMCIDAAFKCQRQLKNGPLWQLKIPPCRWSVFLFLPLDDTGL